MPRNETFAGGGAKIRSQAGRAHLLDRSAHFFEHRPPGAVARRDLENDPVDPLVDRGLLKIAQDALQRFGLSAHHLSHDARRRIVLGDLAVYVDDEIRMALDLLLPLAFRRDHADDDKGHDDKRENGREETLPKHSHAEFLPVIAFFMLNR
ncbi:MAG: hypothetical protein NTW97_00870 [Candidatus Krumholzibacteria bacterium]|nr:hypothetical protein [Candidatus Krumholzibacteria bacterium]